MKNRSGGIGFLGVLQIIFIVLKLCRVIGWSWWVVFIPAYIEILILVVAVAVLYLLDHLDE